MIKFEFNFEKSQTVAPHDLLCKRMLLIVELVNLFVAHVRQLCNIWPAIWAAQVTSHVSDGRSFILESQLD